jgi:hypothetical protein
MIKYSQVDMSEENRRSQIQCYKMLLEKGADPTLYTQRINVFESQLLSGIKVSGDHQICEYHSSYSGRIPLKLR